MRKLIFFIFSVFIWLNFATNISAQEAFVVEKFDSEIIINQDTSLSITEKILVNFTEKRHGIFREIPNVYKIDGKRINSDLKVIQVVNQNDEELDYEISRQGDYVSIKIGDPDIYVFGEQTYIINYEVKNIIQEYSDYFELYWNVTGGSWDTEVLLATAKINSEHANITNITCYSGIVGTTDDYCEGRLFENINAQFNTTKPVGSGRDLTIVLAIDKVNNLILPTATDKMIDRFTNNWGYLVAPISLLYMGISWWKKGRDKRFISDNIYYEPENKDTRSVGLFKRAHLPMVYSPIDNISPGELGTIVDERVDIRDVVAEICELARLKYIKMEIIEKKQLIGKSVDYKFTKLDKDTSNLRDYQTYLLEKLFSGDKTEVKLSDLENKFYKYLSEFKKKIYAWVYEQNYFDNNPDKVRIGWFIKWTVVEIISGVIMYRFFDLTGNFYPLILFGILSVFGLLIAFLMPRKTAKGYAMHRQAKGLSFFVNKGKWREEVNEKRLFFEEMLPLAISLGVVKKLARDMEKLGIAPPNYVHASSNALLYSNIGSLDSKVSSGLASSPKSSGGSGFSGGSSGGGFGGGGGGSW